jgi:hypothetical protein
MKKIKRDNIFEYLLDSQLNMIGKSRVDIIDLPNYRFNLTMTHEQYNEFEKSSIKLLQRVFKFRKEKAVNNFKWFWLNYGVRLKD